ncbi:response regulator [Brasilonema sp. UFV-L1]|uniref:response regulator n=1 Tax=Brasilonema sp. UFV-L1 TaxID=2234130 RepID=UPI00145E1AAF|nr:response regulator [Brasilonema sp. UFV-L1]NMG10015.1 two-component system response regulator [Brasilonema sp. UFV-L1]
MFAKRILVIDDERNLCAVIKVCLEHLGGWQVLISHSGSEGLLLAETEIPDAILLDVMMPDTNGLVLLYALRINAVTRTIPVILLTAKTHPISSNESAQLGIAGVIAKPFDPIQLSDQVKVLLEWE